MGGKVAHTRLLVWAGCIQMTTQDLTLTPLLGRPPLLLALNSHHVPVNELLELWKLLESVLHPYWGLF